MLGIIGGSGFEKFDGFEVLHQLSEATPFGSASSGLSAVKVNGHEALFVSRHGKNHELLPHEVNYRANVFALKKAGAQAIVSFSAVGSLQKDLKPGDLVVPNQYIDRTKGQRPHTFCGEGVVGHVSLAHPTCEFMSGHCRQASEKVSWDAHFGKTYVCIDGPYFSTKAESKVYRQLGADIIGMTHFPEYALVREAGLPYLPCCFVTDYDCWDDSIPHVTLQEVIETMRGNNGKAFEMLKHLVSLGDSLWQDSTCRAQGLKSGLMSSQESLSASQREWLEVIL